MERKPVFGGTDLQEVSAAGEQPTVMFTIERRLMRADLNMPYHIILLMVVIRCTHTHTQRQHPQAANLGIEAMGTN